jgi:hypothetical protein
MHCGIVFFYTDGFFSKIASRSRSLAVLILATISHGDTVFKTQMQKYGKKKVK